MTLKRNNKVEEIRNSENRIPGIEYFLSDVFQNHLIAKNHIDTKINWLLGISGLTMTICLPFLISQSNIMIYSGLLLISLSAVACFLICLISLELPAIFLKNKHEKGSVMFYDTSQFKTPQEIYEELKNIKSYDDILKQYSINIYNLIERNLKIKSRLFKLANHVLFVGLITGFTLIVVSRFV